MSCIKERAAEPKIDYIGDINMEDSNTNVQSTWKKMLISADEDRFRSGWRLLLQTIVMIAFLVLTLGSLFLFSENVTGLPNWLNRLVNPLLTLIAVTAAVYLARRFLDKRSLSSLGLELNKNTLPDFLAGFLIPGLMIGLIFGLELGLGWLEYEGVVLEHDPPILGLFDIFISILFCIFVGWQAELLSRGYHLRNISEGLNTFWGVLLSSLIFAIVHLFGSNASLLGFIGITLSGLFLAYGYLRTHQLWLAMGLHAGWIFFIGPIFGYPVNGFGFPLVGFEFNGIMVHKTTGPTIITGGEFGPEAGLILVPAIALGFLLIYWYTSDRKDSMDDQIEAESQDNLYSSESIETFTENNHELKDDILDNGEKLG
jgi:membrane protease YdiL (CAAX protease family)